MVEVEFKAFLDEVSFKNAPKLLEGLGFQRRQSLRETDFYFNGIAKDFRKTDEALRLRTRFCVSSGASESFLTYKGPKISEVSSARIEHEIKVSDGPTAKKILLALGFAPVLTVDKVRMEFGKDDVCACLDQVKGLGNFMELEIVAKDNSQREKEENRLLSIFDSLGFPRGNLTRKSYLEMLLSKAKKG